MEWLDKGGLLYQGLESMVHILNLKYLRLEVPTVLSYCSGRGTQHWAEAEAQNEEGLQIKKKSKCKQNRKTHYKINLDRRILFFYIFFPYYRHALKGRSILLIIWFLSFLIVNYFSLPLSTFCVRSRLARIWFGNDILHAWDNHFYIFMVLLDCCCSLACLFSQFAQDTTTTSLFLFQRFCFFFFFLIPFSSFCMPNFDDGVAASKAATATLKINLAPYLPCLTIVPDRAYYNFRDSKSASRRF